MDDMETIEVELEEGKKTCEVVSIFNCGKKQYIAVAPVDEEDVYLFGYEQKKDGYELLYIEDDDEFDKVNDRFEEIMSVED